MNVDPRAAKLRFDQFELDEAEARLTRGGQAVPLAPKPFAVLCALARTPRMLVTKNALLDAVWGHRFVTESVLKSAISEVRAALGDDPKQPRYIETVSRRGYRFVAAPAGASQSAPAAERNGAGHPALAALTALCRGDAALAELIRTLAASLERERLVLNQS
jgi:DNA-binding winged helix-turn-helix (wHTH) protein